MSNYSIVMQSSPVAPKKLTALKAYAKKNGIVVSKPVEGKVTLSAVWSETNGTFENDLTPSLAKHLKETVHLLMTISCGQIDDGTGKVSGLFHQNGSLRRGSAHRDRNGRHQRALDAQERVAQEGHRLERVTARPPCPEKHKRVVLCPSSGEPPRWKQKPKLGRNATAS